MKKTVFALLLACGAAFLFAQDIRLPAPKTKAGVDLFDAIRSRAATKDFAKAAVSQADLSTILWAANGMKGTDAVTGASKAARTIPYSGDVAYLNVYYLDDKGAWLYDPAANTLKQVSKTDVRSKVTPEALPASSFMLVFAYDGAKVPSFLKGNQATMLAVVHGTGAFAAENAQLAAAAVKLQSVVMYNIPKPADVQSSLALGKEELPLLLVQFGGPK